MSRIGSATRLLTLAGAGALTACVAVPATLYPQPLAAFPGANKTSAVFAQDDVACRSLASAATPLTPAAAGSGTTGTGTGTVPVQPTPASQYYACMTSRGNVIAAAPSPVSAYYAQYAALYPYPVYGAYAFGGYPYGVYPYRGYYPGLFADEFFLNRSVGFYGGFGFGYGFHGGYGYRGGYGRGFRH